MRERSNIWDERNDPVNPNHAKLLEAARRLDRSNQAEEALLAYRGFLDVQPGNASAWVECAGLLMAMGRLEEAREACQGALRIEPENGSARLTLAKVLMGLGAPEDAEKECRSLLDKDGRRVEARLCLAKCLMMRDELEEAGAELGRVIEQEPGNQMARNLLGEVFLRQGNWSEIRKEMERRLAQHSGPTTDFERACLSLRFGEMPQGWQAYESRWQVPAFLEAEQHYPQSRWEGEPFAGKTLLLFWEQGFGDTLMFVRYAPRVKALGGRVLLVAQAQLADLVATCPGIDEVIAYGEPLPAFDLQLPLLSLPWIFRTDLTSIPSEIPYLDVPKRVPNRRGIADLIAATHGKVRVGLVWAGSPIHKNDARRTIPSRALGALGASTEVAWFSFQVGRSEEVPFPGMISLEPLLSTFSDTAYALSAMDLVITVDTALAHLAGAMGIPTLLLVSSLPDWRWLMGRDDSPWYPSLRIYRQPSPGDWDSVIQRVISDLTCE